MHLSRHIVFEVALYRHLREKWAEKGAKELQRKTIRRWPNALPRVPRGLAISFAVLLGLLATNSARAGTIFVASVGNGVLGEYPTSGATVNASLISGLSNPDGNCGVWIGSVCHEH